MAGVSTSGPGAIKVAAGDLELNADRGPEERGRLIFTNVADRPIQIGSHIHLADVNSGLEFDRGAARGSASTSRPAPRCVSSRAPREASAIVALRGRRVVPGLQIRTDRSPEDPATETQS